ncbi:MAG: hypothetical protein LC749_13520, partial [Actinobacteria bacterium]|nr:hypothetical protein [Actinomycetota bacterium]
VAQGAGAVRLLLDSSGTTRPIVAADVLNRATTITTTVAPSSPAARPNQLRTRSRTPTRAGLTRPAGVCPHGPRRREAQAARVGPAAGSSPAQAPGREGPKICKPLMHERGKSDGPVVPASPPTNAGEPVAEAVEERGPVKGTRPAKRAPDAEPA